MSNPRLPGWIDKVCDAVCTGSLKADTEKGLSVETVSKFLSINVDEAFNVCVEVNPLIQEFI